jgi:hypothetical protein
MKEPCFGQNTKCTNVAKWEKDHEEQNKPKKNDKIQDIQIKNKTKNKGKRNKAQMKRPTCTNETIKNIMKRNKVGSKQTCNPKCANSVVFFICDVCVHKQ